jgi:hypothetical protein
VLLPEGLGSAVHLRVLFTVVRIVEGVLHVTAAVCEAATAAAFQAATAGAA